MSKLKYNAEEASRLSSNQLNCLKAIVSTFLPSFRTPPEASQNSNTFTESFDRELFWAIDVSDNEHFLLALQECILTKLHPEETYKITTLLSLLSTTLGSVIIFGDIFRVSPFVDWNLEDRTNALKSLQFSNLPQKQKAFVVLKRLICGMAFSFVKKEAGGTFSKHESNPFWKGIYPGPYHWHIPQEIDNDKIKENPNLNCSNEFIEVDEDIDLVFDCIIVGSGAGGGVAASVLSNTLYSTVVLEKGEYIPPEQISNLEIDTFDKMYEKHSLLSTEDGNIMVLAGSTDGGGTTIDWGCCLQTPKHVREEWVERNGLDQFQQKGDFDVSMKVVLDRIETKINKHVEHNVANQKQLQACKSLNYKCDSIQTNITDTAEKSAGYTCFGDRYGNKKGTSVTFLHDAVKNGVQVITRCSVQRIVYHIHPHTKKKCAVGVIAHVENNGITHVVNIRARKGVIVAAGSLHTPCLLLRSQLSNPHIGKHLHLHPATCVGGFFPFNEIRADEKAPMTTVYDEFSKTHNSHSARYGAKIDLPSMHTGLFGAAAPWKNAKQFREQLENFNHSQFLIVSQRDQSEGTVCLAKDGFNPSISYDLGKEDKASMIRAICGAIHILIAQGASQITTGHDDDPGLISQMCPTSKVPLFRQDQIDAYLNDIKKRGIPKYNMVLGSAHQMGSCRMGTSPRNSVVDLNGELWECDDLFIFDASIFPTASGTNPMLTTLAMSHMLSNRLVERWRDGLEREERFNDQKMQLEKTVKIFFLFMVFFNFAYIIFVVLS